jgi:hypothetical protein
MALKGSADWCGVAEEHVDWVRAECFEVGLGDLLNGMPCRMTRNGRVSAAAADAVRAAKAGNDRPSSRCSTPSAWQPDDPP